MKSKLKKVVAFFMAFLLTVTVIPENLFASSAAEEATPTDAEGVTGYVTLEVTGFDSLNPAGISYSIYSDSECSDENKVDTLVLSADGKCYVDSEGEVTVYSNTEDLTGTKEAYYAALTAGNYYLKMDALLYDTSNGMETTGISYNREVIEFAISDENPVTLTTEVSIIEETSEEDDSDADFSDDSNTTEVITLSDDEDATEEETEEVATSTDADEEGTEELIGVSALTTAYSLLRSATLTATNQVYITNRASSWSIGQSYGGTFNATYNGTTYAAYCGDHYKDQPSSGYYSVTEVTGSSTSDVNIRRVMAYVIDNYGTGTSISNTNRGYISLAINNAKGNKSVSAGNTIKNKAYAAFSSNPLTGSQVSFSLSSTSLTTSSAATITPSGSSSSVSVRTTSLITLTGNTNNYITVSLPAGMFMSYNSKWYGSNSSTTSVTIHASSSGTASLRFAISASYTGDKEATFTGSAGYNVYRTNSPSGYQYIYWGYKVSAKTVTLTATNEVGYLRILKTSDTASTSSNSGCTKAVFTVTDSTGTVATGTIGYGYTTYNDGTYYCINNKCWEVTEYGESIGAKASYASAFPLENIDGNEYILRLPVGKYTITETTIPDLYVSTTTSKTITITAGKMASPTTVTWTNEKDTGGLKLHKRYASGFASSYCSSLSNYSREGAVYEVYTTTGDGGEMGTHIATFKTTASGTGHVKWCADGYSTSNSTMVLNGIEVGTWVYVIETEPSPGCELDTTVHYAQITDTEVSVDIISYEPVNADPLAIKIQKADSLTGNTVATAAGTLAGAEFTVKYYDVDPDEYTTLSSISGLTATRTWTFETDENGKIFCNDYSYYSGGDELYYDSGDIVIPYGVVTIEETSAPDGYTTEGSYFFNSTSGTEYTDGIIFATVTEEGMLYLNGTNFVSADSVTLIKEEQPERADIKLIKVDAETGEPISGVAFKLTSVTTGESHILVTDEDGVIDTSAISHSTNTNASDSSYKSGSGVWFYGNTTNTGDIDDSLGALPCDKYILSELSTDANAGHVLIDDIEIDLTDENLYSDGYCLYEIGTIDNSPEPKIRTTAFGKDTEDGVISANSTVTIYDEVSYSYLTAGKTYTIKGIIMDAETGKAVVDASGNYITGSKTFTLDDDYESYKEEKCGTVTVEYTIDTTGFEGKSLVVYEYLYSGTNTTEFTIKSDGTVDETDVYTTNTGTVIKHTDLTDENQTLYVPEIETSLIDSETDSHSAMADEEVTLVDTVTYTNLIIGKEYTVTGVLMNKETGEELLDASGNTVTASKTFTATKSYGTVDITFVFDASLLAGTTTVAFEGMTYNGKTVAAHSDITDAGQTVYFPEIGTTLTDSETLEHIANADEKVTLIDTVTYSNLIVGEKYTVSGILMNKTTGNILLDAEGNTVTASETFTAESTSGTVDIVFTFDASVLAGETTVAFETITYNEVEVAVHADIDDEEQTVYFPEIGTTLTDSETLDHVANADETVTLVDTVAYSNLIVGKEYTVSGTLMNKATGGLLIDASGNTITASETFTAESTSGTIDIVFTFDASLLKGETTVAFETITYNEVEVAVHADIDDKEQTVYFPNGGTSAIDKSTGTQEGEVSSKVTIIDTVTYENLIVGKEYTVTGVLMDKSTGKEYKDASGNTVTATVTFTAEELTGSVDVEFTFNGSNLAGTSVVVFETVYYNEVEVFTHADISDEEQTVTYPPETTTPPVKTGDNTPITAVIVIFALAVIGAGSILALKRRKRNK